MKIVIVGCGRLGSQLAMQLDADGHSVVAVDIDPGSLERLGSRFGGKAIVGSGWGKGTMELCAGGGGVGVGVGVGVGEGGGGADALVALTGSDNDNIVTALTAKQRFFVPKVVARIYDSRRALIYRRLGVPTVAPTTWGAHKIRELVLYPDFHPEHGFGNGEVEMVRVKIPARLSGMSVGSLMMPGRVEAVALTRQGVASIPSSATLLEAGDVVRLTVEKSALPRLKELMELGA